MRSRPNANSTSSSQRILPPGGGSVDKGGAMRDRLLRVARVVGAVVITVAVAAAAGAAAIYLTGPGGSISCVPAAAPASPDPIPRWVIAAGIPAVVAAFTGSFF